MCAVEATPMIATDRLRLRALKLEDAPRMAELANDPGVAGMTTTLPHPYAPADAEAFLGRMAGVNPGRERAFAVEHRQFGLIGVLGFHPNAQDRCELGYWLGRPFWGRGYATEAVAAALGWAAQGWRKRALWSGHFADNGASGQVLCKTGFLYTGDVELRPSRARGRACPTRMMVWLA